MTLSLRITSLALVLLVATPASANEQAKEYVIAIERAVAEFGAGNWAEAASHFERAHALRPSARTQRGLGLAYFENHQYAKALEHLRAAMIDTRMPLTEEQRRELFETIENAERSVARFKIALSPRTAELRVDGSVARTEEGVLSLDPGEHELVVSSENFRTERRTVLAAPGRSEELSFALQSQRQEQSASDHSHRGAGSSKIGPWSTIAVGGAGLVTAVATGVLALKRHDRLENACRDDVCAPDLRDTRSQGQALKLATNILIAGSAATVAGGLLWLLLTRRSESPKATAYFSAKGCGAHFSMDF